MPIGRKKTSERSFRAENGEKYMNVKKIILFAIVLCMLSAVLCGCIKKTGTVTAEMVIKDYGTVTLTLDRSQAPITVDHFVKLAKSGAYDGTKIIRMQAGFVLQGGAGATDTSTIKGEFSQNGVQNNIQHKKGVISMARGEGMDSASAQFFIVLDDRAQSSLDGRYAGFGRVTDGWEVIEKICSDITSDKLRYDYYGVYMGFLKDSEYITIEKVRIVPIWLYVSLFIIAVLFVTYGIYRLAKKKTKKKRK